MNGNDLQNKVIGAAKWSSITEIMSKLISPVTNMILARLLTPEAFGVVATVTMIVSFADMFTDSGFQKYIVQHEFKDEIEKYRSSNIAFWTNFAISVLLCIILIIFREQIAILVGNPGLGNVIAISCLQLPLTSFSSIQIALYKRDFDFKTLFIVRMVSICIPFVITVPLAFLGLSYWALIIGTVAIQLANAIILTIKSKWKPKFYYNIKILKEMFSFSMWSLIEAISIWLTTWADTFIIGSVLNQYYLGIYKTSTSMVNTIMTLITSAIIPVLFSTLSRLQDDDKQFKHMYYKIQGFVSIFVLPLGIGMFIYSDLATSILLGSKWSEASNLIGIWALMSSIMIVFSNFSSEVYRAKGKPKLSFVAQMLHLAALVPACIISSNYGFWPLALTRSLIRLQSLLVNLLLLQFVVGIPFSRTIKNTFPSAASAVIMGVLGFFLRQVGSGILWSLISIVLCVLLYFAVLLLFFPNTRKDMFSIIETIIPKRIRIQKL